MNSTITPNTVFTKTAQKFGQWSDPKAGTIYGVGFPNEEDLLKVRKLGRKSSFVVKLRIQMRRVLSRYGNLGGFQIMRILSRYRNIGGLK